MRYIIASDVHGSYYYAKKILEVKNRERADKIILLGDIYNHGPRNPLPEDYAPMKVAELFNSVKDDLIVIKGNCDSEVDTMISDFDFLESACIVSNEKTIFCTHGHVYNKDNMPKTKFDAVIYGHFHTGFIERINGVVVANAGSVSLPKNETKNSFMVLDENALKLKDMEGNTLEEVKL